MCEKQYLCDVIRIFRNQRYCSRKNRCIAYFLTVLAFLVLSGNCILAQEKNDVIQNGFLVKYVTAEAVYLRGGHAVGLSVGQRLEIKRNPENTSEDPGVSPGETQLSSPSTKTIAWIEVVSVANSSAVCEIKTSDGEIQPGDIAYFSDAELKRLNADRAAAESEKYPQVISFTEGNPLEEEARASVLTTPLPEVNRMRGRLGLEYNTIMDPNGAGMNSRQMGILARMDFTRLGGTYWDFKGYYRGRLTSRTRDSDDETLTDLINRTYHLSLTYNNPQSGWEAGFGRMYLPWASSLGTIDGGYFGRRIGKVTTLGIFGGSAPDPTSWDYDRDRQLGGVYANFNAGHFESVRLTSTVGLALSGIRWKTDRQYGFFENGLFYKRYLSVSHNLEADLLKDTSLSGEKEIAISRSYLTVRFQPIRFIGFDFSHNYFRNIPTFDSRLIGTGLVDNLLFEGFNGGIRVQLPYSIRLYSNLGRSQRTGNTNPSLNRTYGVTFGQIGPTGIRADFRYSSFDNTFGKGLYRSVTISREIGKFIRFNIRGGQQDFTSELTPMNRSRFLSMDSDYFLGRHYVLGAGFTIYRGQAQEYDQWYVNLGYRF
ncbi:MAG: hypothetical protein P8Y80_09950 [Acidobacteriota bacterium]|jgi:hypothetical protein